MCLLFGGFTVALYIMFYNYWKSSMYSFTYPEKPKDIVLLLTKIWGISVAGYCIAEQPETKCTGKYVNVFLHYTKSLNI